MFLLATRRWTRCPRSSSARLRTCPEALRQARRDGRGHTFRRGVPYHRATKRLGESQEKGYEASSGDNRHGHTSSNAVGGRGLGGPPRPHSGRHRVPGGRQRVLLGLLLRRVAPRSNRHVHPRHRGSGRIVEHHAIRAHIDGRRSTPGAPARPASSATAVRLTPPPRFWWTSLSASPSPACPPTSCPTPERWRSTAAATSGPGEKTSTGSTA